MSLCLSALIVIPSTAPSRQAIEGGELHTPSKTHSLMANLPPFCPRSSKGSHGWSNLQQVGVDQLVALHEFLSEALFLGTKRAYNFDCLVQRYNLGWWHLIACLVLSRKMMFHVLSQGSQKLFFQKTANVLGDGRVIGVDYEIANITTAIVVSGSLNLYSCILLYFTSMNVWRVAVFMPSIFYLDLWSGRWDDNLRPSEALTDPQLHVLSVDNSLLNSCKISSTAPLHPAYRKTVQRPNLQNTI